MSIRQRMFKGGGVLVAGQILIQAMSLLRNIIVARLLSPADFGIAATLWITVSLLEMISNLGGGTLLIQAEDGDEPEFLSTAHCLSFWRGTVNATLLFTLAWPMSILFDIPHTRWAFQCLALFPLIKGLAHLDTMRLQRKMDFKCSVAVEFASQLAAVLAAGPLALWLRDYSAMLWLILLQRSAATAVSLMVAERPYRWSWNSAYVRRIMTFGWPLLINGVLMFCIFQGDRALIGSARRLFSAAAYTMTDLGLYSAAFTLAMVANSAVSGVANSLLLPFLAQAQNAPALFDRRYGLSIQALALVGGATGIIFILAGRTIVELVYGSNYAAATTYMGWFAAMQAIRMIRLVPNTAAMAKGDTRNPMVANALRSLALVGSAVVAARGGELVWMAVCAVGAEVLAMGGSLHRLRREHGIGVLTGLGPTAVVGMVMLASGLLVMLGLGASGHMVAILAATIAVAGLVVAMAAIFPRLRSELQSSGALVASRLVPAVLRRMAYSGKSMT